MPENPRNYPLKLDPWAASSLLQKAIRRGKAILAQQALSALYRYRGQAVWRRLAIIALEDVGIADPDLVWDCVRLATDSTKRASRSFGVLTELTARLASAPKDRSADYVCSGATLLETAQADRRDFDTWDWSAKLEIATADLEPVTRRAVAALSACTVVRGEQELVDDKAARLFARAFHNVPDALLNSAMALTGRNSHPFGLILVLLWSQYEFTGGASGYSIPPLPPAEYVNGIPLYTFDKHTAVGKRAIAKLVEESSALRETLRQHVPEQHWLSVAEIAAFYADAAPVAYRLQWFSSELLEFGGFIADTMAAGCPMAGACSILSCLRDNLTHLNKLRRADLGLRRLPIM